MEQKIDWIIHYVANGVVCGTGKVENSFIPYACNAHTHGMKKYDHKDFQIVLAISPAMIGYILNTLSQRVQCGEYFESGDMVSEILQDYDVRLEEFEETGRKVLRVILPDKNHLFPSDPGCDPCFAIQSLSLEQLEAGNGIPQ